MPSRVAGWVFKNDHIARLGAVDHDDGAGHVRKRQLEPVVLDLPISPSTAALSLDLDDEQVALVGAASVDDHVGSLVAVGSLDDVSVTVMFQECGVQFMSEVIGDVPCARSVSWSARMNPVQRS